ncbi:hypothetical protein ACFODO_07630 [Acinetobacter sichuanensis]|uniref:Uncharacterized protein n=1 Tax=Acinetobacter sichuanensis TaxID=2136183 RepID=A0A371YIL8_9GAMM|nr:hypothetical protein [Acinetobacter sichuanensis]RFC81270.1 hypothetical protein C9E89_022775 [Acinetobacter sichuanensis]
MEKLIKVKDINISTTPSVIAQDVFKKAVSPVITVLEKEGRESVKEFTFCSMWLAMGLYVNNLSTSDAEKALNHATSNVIKELKKMRGEK